MNRQQRWYANLTEEQKQQRLAKARLTPRPKRKARTPEQKAKYAAQRVERRKTWTPEKRDAERQKRLKYYEQITPEKREQNKKKSAEALAKITPEEKQRRKLLVAAHLATHPESKQRILDRNKGAYVKRQLRPAQNLCAATLSCNEPPIGKQKFCLWHWCQSIRSAERRITPTYTVDELVALWNQQDKGRCPITGLQLIPGETATLDHIIPICKSGPPDITNVRFIHDFINRAKWDMTEVEFKEWVRVFVPRLIEWAKKDI